MVARQNGGWPKVKGRNVGETIGLWVGQSIVVFVVLVWGRLLWWASGLVTNVIEQWLR